MTISALDNAVLTRRCSLGFDDLSSPDERSEREPGAQVGLRDLVALLRRRFRLIAAVMVAGVSLSLLAANVLPKTYKAQATLVFEPADPNLLEEAPGQPTFQPNKAKMDTESDLMLSRALASRVVDELGLVAQPDFNTYLRRADPARQRTVSERARDALSSIGRAVGDLLPDGHPLKASLVEQSDQAGDLLPSDNVQRDRAITTLLSRLSVTRSGDSLAMTVSATDNRPDTAAKLADAATELFVKWSRERKRENIKSGVSFLRDQAGELAARIAEIEGRAAEHQDENNVSTDARDDLLRSAIQQTNVQLSAARGDLTQARARVAQIESATSGRARVAQIESATSGRARVAQIESATSEAAQRADPSLSSAFMTSLRNDEAVALRDRAQLARNHGVNHPLMQEADRKIASVRSLIGEEAGRIVIGLEEEVRVAERRVRELEESLAAASKEVRQRGLAEIKLREINRDLMTEQRLHDVVSARLGKLDPYASVAQPDARVVSVAEVPTEPSFPRWRILVGGGLAGALVIGVLLAVTLEAFDRRIKNPQQVRQILKAPLLAEVPRLSRQSFGRSRGLFDQVAGRPRSRFSEEMWVVYRACMRAVGAGGHRVLLVASALPSEGKTAVALGIAIAAAKDGSRTGLVSLDPHPRSLKSLLPVALAPRSLADYMDGRCGLSDVVTTVPDVPHLEVLASRVDPHGDETIGLERVRRLLNELRLRYDLVVIEAPPALADVGGTALASCAQAVVLVAAWNRTTEQALVRTAALLRLEDAPLVGFLMSGSQQTPQHARAGWWPRRRQREPLGQPA